MLANMDVSNFRNMVVLKNLPSNIVEEAYVILKPNSKIKKMEYTQKKGENAKEKRKNSQEYIVKEAEMILYNYINSLEKTSSYKQKELEKKYKRLKWMTGSLVAIFGFAFLVQLLV